jgi:hypothetical protein
MFRDTIKQTLLSILTKELLINRDRIHSFVFFDRDLDINEDEFNRLLYFVESSFDIVVPENEVTLHSRLTDLVMYINNQWVINPFMDSHQNRMIA